MRRSRRQRENENEMIQAIKYWQRSAANALIFVGLPVALAFVAFAFWVGTPSGREFTGWTDVESRSEKRLESLQNEQQKRLESLQNEQQKRLDEFTESTNEDVQNTNDNIESLQNEQQKRLESLQNEQQKRLDEFTESTKN